MDNTYLEPFRRGETLTGIRSGLEKLRRRTRNTGQITGGSGVSVTQSDAGTVINLLPTKTSLLPAQAIGSFFAILTGNSDDGPAFTYNWSEAEISGSTLAVKDPGRSGTEARNLFEVFNSAQYKGGVDVDGTDYPAGFGFRPVGGGGADDTHKINAAVLMWVVADSGTVSYWFNAPTSHDGNCSAP